MNGNQIINMIMRIIMRKTISKGIDVGVNQATRATRGRGQATAHIDHDDRPDAHTGAPADLKTDAQNGPTKAQIRQQRQARRAARQARQAGKNQT